MLYILLAVLGGACSLWLAPFRHGSECIQLFALALPFAGGAALLGRVGDRLPLAHASRRARAHALEIWLFGDDVRVLLHSLRGLLGWSIGSALRSLAALALAAPLLAGGVLEVESRFAYRALAPGEPVIVTLQIDTQDPSAKRAVELHAALPLVVETPALHIPARAQILWRIHAAEPGLWPMRASVGGAVIGHSVAVVSRGAPSWQALPPVAAAMSRHLASPVATRAPVRMGALELWVDYPPAHGYWFGLASSTWIWLAMTAALTFAIRRRLWGV